MVRQSQVLEFLFILVTGWSPAWIFCCSQRRYKDDEYEKEGQSKTLRCEDTLLGIYNDDNGYIPTILAYIFSYIGLGLWLGTGRGVTEYLIIWVGGMGIGTVLQLSFATRDPLPSPYSPYYRDEPTFYDSRGEVYIPDNSELAPKDGFGKRRRRRFSVVKSNSVAKPKQPTRDSVVAGTMLGIYRDENHKERIQKRLRRLLKRQQTRAVQGKIKRANAMLKLAKEEEELEKKRRKSKNPSEMNELQRRMTIIESRLSQYEVEEISDDEMNEFQDAKQGNPKPVPLKFII